MKIVGVMPAYNAGKVLERVIRRVPEGYLHQLIVVDDGSKDNTYNLLSSLPGITVIRHSQNQGYGGAQITLHKAALESGADCVIHFHADGGHYPEEIPNLLDPVLGGKADVVIGSRILGIVREARALLGSKWLGAALRGHMPTHIFVGNIGLTFLQNVVFGTHYRGFHDGFRACTREALQRIPFQQFMKRYLFDTEFLLASHLAGLRIVEVPVRAYYDKDAGSRSEPFSYGLRILWLVLRYRLGLYRP